MSVETSDVREVGRELLIAMEQGETRTVEALREQFALGTGALTEALDMLRENGQAVEVAPGEWRGPTQDEIDAQAPEQPREESAEGRVRVALTPAGDEPTEPETGPIRAVDGSRMEFYPVGEATVRLTRSIADRLTEEALGSIVKAALEGHDAGEPFVLEVTP